MFNKKAIGPVVASALLLVVAVVSVVGFQTWFNTYSTTTFSQVESQSSSYILNSKIQGIVGNDLYFNSGSSNKSVYINSIKVDNVNCNISGYSTSTTSILKFNISSCIINSSNPIHNVMVITKNKIFNKNIFINNLNSLEPIINLVIFNVSEIAILNASDPQAYDYFSQSVSIDGNYTFISSYMEDQAAIDAGAVYIFERNSTGSWNEIQKIMASDAQAGDKFGYSVSVSGDFASIGANYEDQGSTDAGAVYIFERNLTGSWNEVQKVIASDAQASDRFGTSVGISGIYLLVGAYLEDTGGISAGAAYLFERNSTGSWNEVQKIMASDFLSHVNFGRSVSIDGNFSLIGAFREDSISTDAGAAYIFERNSTGSWNEIQKITSSDAQTTDYFGYSTSISGDYLVITSYLEDSSGTDSGSAYIFERNSTGSWNEVKKIIGSDGKAGDNFGISSSISGKHLIIGSYLSGPLGNNSGQAYIFERNNSGLWGEVQILNATDTSINDYFGFSVDIGGNYIVVGSTGKDVLGSSSGGAYIFE